MFKKKNLGFGLALIVLVMAVINGCYWLYLYGDKFPHLDEWHFVPVPKNESFFEYAFRFNNENLQFFTNLKFYLIEYFGWTWGSVKYISYFIYVLLVVVLFNLLKKYVQGYSLSLLCLLFISFFTHYSIEVSLWVILSQSWFYFIFIFWAIKFGFSEKKIFENIWIVVFMVFCSIISMNIAFAICFGVIYLAKNVLNSKNVEDRLACLFNSLIFLEIMVVFVVVFWINMRKGDDTLILWSKLFSKDFFYWLFYVLLSPCFGMVLPLDNPMLVLCVGWCLFFVVGYLFFKQIKKVDKQMVWALFLVICGGMIAIVLFRGSHVLQLTTYASRYIIYSLCLGPCLYVIFAQDDSKLVRCVGNILALVMLCCVGNNFFGNRLIDTYEINLINEKCIMDYYAFENRPLVHYCVGKYWGNIAPKLNAFEKVFLQNQ